MPACLQSAHWGFAAAGKGNDIFCMFLLQIENFAALLKEKENPQIILPARTGWEETVFKDELWIPGLQWEMGASCQGGARGGGCVCTSSFHHFTIPKASKMGWKWMHRVLWQPAWKLRPFSNGVWALKTAEALLCGELRWVLSASQFFTLSLSVAATIRDTFVIYEDVSSQVNPRHIIEKYQPPACSIKHGAVPLFAL